MKILSLITHYASIPEWESQTTRIDNLDPQWSQRSLLQKLLVLLRFAPTYDRIVFFHDTRLPTLFWLIYWILHRKNTKKRLIFVTFLCDVARFRAYPILTPRGLYERARYLYHYSFVRMFRAVVVHSSHEKLLYASVFRLPADRFYFVPYCVRPDTFSADLLEEPDWKPAQVVVAGRHRDFRTFITAVTDLPLDAAIIAGDSDRALIGDHVPRNVTVHYEIPFEEYRWWVTQASVFVIPLFDTQITRSLGQIAALEAVANYIPVVAARTFQLSDYFLEDVEMLFYTPGDSSGLQKQIVCLLQDEALRARLTTAAHARLLARYTPKQFCGSLLRVCLYS